MKNGKFVHQLHDHYILNTLLCRGKSAKCSPTHGYGDLLHFSLCQIETMLGQCKNDVESKPPGGVLCHIIHIRKVTFVFPTKA
jgi:hypothetical protein